MQADFKPMRQRAMERNGYALQTEAFHRITLVEDRPPVQTVTTDPTLPVTLTTPQGDEIVHIGSVIPALLSLPGMARQIVLDGYRMAFLRHRWLVSGVTYIIDDVFFSPEPRHTGKIFARLRKDVVHAGH